MVNMALVVGLVIPLSILSFLVISPELRRRRNNNNNNNNNNDNNSNNSNNNADSDNVDLSLHNIGKVIGNAISIIIILNILLISIRSFYSFSSTVTSLSSLCSAPSGINLIGAYGNIIGLDGIRNITARKSETQILFKQGMIHLYGFNFEEANRNMKAAISIENDCIMCYWGLAYSYGPNINLGVYSDAAKNGRIAIQKAISLLKRNNVISQKEIDLVYAQYERFQGSLKEWEKNGQQYYDEKYSNAMKILTTKYPMDYDIAAESVDAIMLLRPWDYYTNNYTELHPDIKPAYDILKNVLLHVPAHALALHLWIHITEQGSNPSQALKQADMLLGAGEGIAHLVHMPSHIYFRTGYYSKCINSSLMSIETDNYYTSKCFSPYVTNHNKALLVLCATYSGRYYLALEYATPSALFMEDDASKYVSALFPNPKELIYTRYGKWQNIIELQIQEEKEFDDKFIASRPAYIKSLRQYSRLLAIIHTSNNSTELIINSLQRFNEVINDIPVGSPPLVKGHVFYPYHHESGILMNSIIQAAWLLKKQSPQYISAAIDYLENAVNLQDSFLYMEPEHWYLPIRQCLASALIAFADVSKTDNRINILLKARKLYDDDLIKHPNNGWSFIGIIKLNEKLKNLGYNETIAANTKELYHRAWALADITIHGSCCELNFC